MRYAGWNFEKTLLVRDTAIIERPGEFVDVRLAVESDRAANIENDARVILKKDWNILDREVPSQVYGVERHGATTTFRVAFHVDVGRGDQRRVGVYYDNPKARRASDTSASLEVRGAGLAHTIETPFYIVQTDAKSGQLTSSRARSTIRARTNFRRMDPPAPCSQATRSCSL